MKEYKIKATYSIDVEYEVLANSEGEAVSKFLREDVKDVINDGRILRVDSEDETVELTYATFRVKTTSIDYAIEEEDIMDEVILDPAIEEDSDEYYAALHRKVEEIKSSLPQELSLEVYCTPELLDEYVADAISQETGWLINDCSYEIIEEK